MKFKHTKCTLTVIFKHTHANFMKLKLVKYLPMLVYYQQNILNLLMVLSNNVLYLTYTNQNINKNCDPSLTIIIYYSHSSTMRITNIDTIGQ